MQSFAVGDDVDGAVVIGSQDADACELQPFEDFGTGMAVGIAGAGGNDGDAGTDRSEEIRGGRTLAAVMADFENIGLKNGFRVFAEDSVLGLLFGVAGQKKSFVAEVEAQDEGVVVLCGGGGVGRGGFGPKKFAGDAVPGKVLSAKFMFDGNAPVAGERFEG